MPSFNAVDNALEAATWSREWFRRLEAAAPLFDDEFRAWLVFQHRDAIVMQIRRLVDVDKKDQTNSLHRLLKKTQDESNRETVQRDLATLKTIRDYIKRFADKVVAHADRHGQPARAPEFEAIDARIEAMREIVERYRPA